MQNSFNPAALTEWANAPAPCRSSPLDLPTGSLPRIGHIPAQPSGGRDGGLLRQGRPGGAGTPAAPRPNATFPRNRPKGDAQQFTLPEPARGTPFPTKPWELGTSSHFALAGGGELGVRPARAGGEGSDPWRRLREPTAQPWTTPEPASQRALADGLGMPWQPRVLGRWQGPRGDRGSRRGSGQGRGHTLTPMDPLGEPRPNWRHWSCHTPAPSALDPQVSNVLGFSLTCNW